MRYLTHNDLGQMGLEEAIAWEQLRGLGGLGENGDAVYWSDTHDSPSSGGSDSGALTCRGGSCKPKITKIITYQPPAKVQQTVQQPSSYMVQPGAKYGSSAPPSPSELIGSKMRVYQCGPNGCNIAPEVYPQISAAQIQSYGPQKVIQSLPSAPVKVAPSAAAPVDCNAAFNKWCALNNQFLDAQAMSKWLVDNKFDATAIRAANQRRDGIATQMANMNSQLSSCDRARFALGVAGCGPHVAAAPAVNLPPHLDVPADTNVYAPMPQSLDTTSQDVRPVGFIPEHDLYEKLWAIQQGWGPKPKAPAPAAVPPPVVVPVVPGIPMPAPYASAGSVNLLAPLAPSGIAVRPEAPMQVIQPSVAKVRNLDVQAQEVRAQIKDYEAQSRGPNQDPAAEEAAYKLRKVLASIEANKKAIMAPSGRPTTYDDLTRSLGNANEAGLVRLTQSLDNISAIQERTDAEAATSLSRGERGFLKEFMPLAVQEARDQFLKDIYAGVTLNDSESARMQKVAANMFAMRKGSKEDLEIADLIKHKGEGAVAPEKLLKYKIKQQFLQTYKPTLARLGATAYSAAASGGDAYTVHENYVTMTTAINKMESIVANGTSQAITEKFLNPAFKTQALDYAMDNVLGGQLEKLRSAGAGSNSAASLEQGLDQALKSMPQPDAARIVGQLLADDLTARLGKINYSDPNKVVSQIVDIGFDIYKGDTGVAGPRQELIGFLREPIAKSGGIGAGHYLQKAYAAARAGDAREAQAQMNEVAKVISASARLATAYTYQDEPKFAQMADKLAQLQIAGSWLAGKVKQQVGGAGVAAPQVMPGTTGGRR